MKFVLEIDKMAYDAMQTPDEVSAAIREVADKMEGDTLPARATGRRPIHDLNGNTVGGFEFVAPQTLTTTLSTGYKLYPDTDEDALVLIGDDGLTREQMFSTLDPDEFERIGESMIAAARARRAELAEQAALSKRIGSAAPKHEGMF